MRRDPDGKAAASERRSDFPQRNKHRIQGSPIDKTAQSEGAFKIFVLRTSGLAAQGRLYDARKRSRRGAV